jgi:hypothetical protein
MYCEISIPRFSKHRPLADCSLLVSPRDVVVRTGLREEHYPMTSDTTFISMTRRMLMECDNDRAELRSL